MQWQNPPNTHVKTKHSIDTKEGPETGEEHVKTEDTQNDKNMGKHAVVVPTY